MDATPTIARSDLVDFVEGLLAEHEPAPEAADRLRETARTMPDFSTYRWGDDEGVGCLVGQAFPSLDFFLTGPAPDSKLLSIGISFVAIDRKVAVDGDTSLSHGYVRVVD